MEDFTPDKELKKYKVKCITCNKQVELTFPYRRRQGDKYYTAVCPECEKLAYNSLEEPPMA